MPIDLTPLAKVTRLLFSITLKPVQGARFQPTGFPNLGAATYQTADGLSLLVESAQSMANRLEMTCWDSANNRPIDVVKGISHVVVERHKKFLTDSMLEAHRINSPYLLEGSDETFLKALKSELGELDFGPIDRASLARALLKYDIGSLLHGAFLAKKELAGGRLRLSRVLSAFIEASGVHVAASGGVKNDHVHPSGDTKNGFGNVPFARDEYTAGSIMLFVNMDVAQIRGYGLGADAERLLILLALFKLRVLLDGDLRLRTACDLCRENAGPVTADAPHGFALPERKTLEDDLKTAIEKCKGAMSVTTVVYNDTPKKGKEDEGDNDDDAKDGE